MTTKTKPASELDEFFEGDGPTSPHDDSSDATYDYGKELAAFNAEIKQALDELLPNASPQKLKAVLKAACSTDQLPVLFEKEEASFWIGKLNSFIVNVENKAVAALNTRKNRITDNPDKPITDSASDGTQPVADIIKKFGIEIANAAYKRTGNKKLVKAFVKAACEMDNVADMFAQNDNPKFWIAKIFAYRDPVADENKRGKYVATVKGGAQYYKAPGRILEFRAAYPESRATISTELVQFSSDLAVFKAMIIVDGQLVATAHAMCTPQGAERAQGRYLEMAETNAVARALGYFGFGTNLLEKDDGPHYMADSPVKPTDKAIE